MIDPAIKDFIDGRKEAWLKKNIKATMDEAEIAEKQADCEQVFLLENWLPNAAKRAGQMSLATHPCTLSHPSARKNKNGYATPVIAKGENRADGYLRTGNVVAETDALGNAAAIDVYKFLTLEMSDGRRLIDHVHSESELAIKLLTINCESYESLRSGFLAMIETDGGDVVTSSKIKQVYFPVGSDYHQLSILSHSGLIFELRKRIDDLRFSDDVKALRELKRKNEFSERGFSEIYNLTTIGYGGTKPQNISVLNNQNGGKAHLLLSAPPELQKRDVRFPKRNFFGESLRYYDCKEQLEALQKLFKTEYNNVLIREGVDFRLQELMDRIMGRMWAVRAVAEDQYRSESAQLKQHQKIWLCEGFIQDREEQDGWLDELCLEMTNWIIRAYEKLVGKQAYKLGEEERKRIHSCVSENREALR